MPASVERQIRPGAATLTSPAGVDPIASPGKRTLVDALSMHPTGAPGRASGAAMSPSTQGTTAIGRALDLCQLGLAHLAAVETALALAYRRAVAAVDTHAVEALAWQIIGGVARIVDAQGQVVQLVPQVDTSPHAVMASTTNTDPGEPDPSQLAALTKAKASLDTAIHVRIPTLAVQVSPQWFGDELVAGRTAEAPPHVQQVLVQLAYEVETVVQLLCEADIIAQLIRPTDDVRGTSERATEGARAEALDRVERWRSRPINFLFLMRVLSQRGVWQELQGARNASGHTAEELQRKVTAQARETGTTADVGALWDADDAHRALSYSRTDWRITDDEATHVLEMLTQAEPRARAGLVKQLYRMGRLRPLCEHLPWGAVKQLWESIDDAEASRLLEPYWVGRGGGKSLGKRLQEQDRWYTDLLNRFLDISTFGAKPAIDAAHDAREAGLISDGAYWGSVTKAIGRSAFVMAAMTATGGVAGELAGEFTGGALEGMGVASRTVVTSAATVASGVAGGGAGNVAGHLVGDIYDQVLDGKSGFDSLGSYGRSLKEGAILGGVAGGVTAAAGLAASRYLPLGLRTVAQQAAATHPQLTPLLEAARSVGRGMGARVRLPIDKLLQAIAAGGPPGLRFAVAGGGSLPPHVASAPPTALAWVTVRSLVDLNAPQPMQMAGGRDQSGYLGEISDIELSEEVAAIFDGLSSEDGYSHPDMESFAGETSRLGDSGPELDAINVRRTKDDAGVVKKPGQVHTHQHHIFPQEKASWFRDRGVDVDEWCIDLTPPEHQAQHGGGSSQLARRVAREQPEAEWNAAIMDRLHTAEATKRLTTQNSNTKLTATEILQEAAELMIQRGLGSQPFRKYSR